ncbi:hypothetical protein BDV30DRAFT_205985 [Aspergillus minisclerotigenes]|uniref:Uncharacterized protein n=1 Tax=Aspergillus minisclerotigenes TaxID=656917 RepID=A0A5N6JG16_9EURO|nr:hypothetical protein BDV30DRAFT_205985 [Aspergillus minisclerotigenes]
MSSLPDLSHKEPSAQTLMEQAKSRVDNAREDLSNPHAEPVAGVQTDQSRNARQDLDKGGTAKTSVEGGHSSRMVERMTGPSGIH